MSVFWLAFLVSCELTAKILYLVFFFCQLWKFQQKYRYINFIIRDALEVIGVNYLLLHPEINGKCVAIVTNQRKIS